LERSFSVSACPERPGEFFESFVVRNCGDRVSVSTISDRIREALSEGIAREAFRHLLDQNSIDKDFDQSLTPVPAAESVCQYKLI